MHVPDQFGQAELPFDVRLGLGRIMSTRVRRARLGKWDKITSVVAIRWANVCLPEPGGAPGHTFAERTTRLVRFRGAWTLFGGRDRGACA